MADATVQQIATLLDVTPRYVTKLVKDRGFPRIAHGAYDIVASVRWYVRFQRGRIEELEKGSEGEQKARGRLHSALADIKELDLAERKRELVAIPDVIREIERILVATRAKMLGIPKKAAPRLVGKKKPSQIEALLEKYIYEALHEISRIPLAAGSAPRTHKRRVAEGVVEDETTAEVDGKRLGG